MPTTLPIAQRFLDALVRQDYEALGATLAPGVAFRALVPGEQVSVGTAADAVACYRRWFADKTDIEIADARSDVLVDKVRMAFELRLKRRDEPLVVGHTLAGDIDGERFATLDLLCTGFRPVGAAPASGTTHVFDAGDLGCGSGLPREFRARIQQIPVGHVLEVVTGDPSAKEDLPSMARLLGHEVRAVDETPDGTTHIRVERMK